MLVGLTMALALLIPALQACGGRSVDGEGGAAGQAGAGTSGASGTDGTMPSAAAGATDAAAGAASAGAGGQSPPSYFNGSCSLPGQSVCNDYYFQTGELTSYFKLRCAGRGTWDADKPCPGAGQLGSCTLVEGVPITVTTYYDAQAAMAGKAECVGNWQD